MAEGSAQQSQTASGLSAADVGGGARTAVGAAGNVFRLFVEVIRGLFKRPFQFREFIDQTWFIASVTILPSAFVAIPFGAVVAMQTGSLVQQLGAEAYTGATGVLAVVQQGAPLVTSLLIAGAAGSAVAADLGARTIREELDAMRVLGIDPVQRLVVPRVLGMMLVAVLLNGLVSIVGIAGVVAAYCGMNPKGGPKGVGDAVNLGVVVTFLLLFFANLILTAMYLQIVPPKGS